VDQRFLPLDRRYFYNWTGLGVDIYMLDSGILMSHVDFGGRASCGLNLADNGACQDLLGHGTHVAGILGGSYYGVAKEANLIGVRIIFSTGWGPYSFGIGGLDYVIRQAVRANKTVIATLSLGGQKSEALNLAIENAVKAGVFVAVAAGNNAGDACDYSPSSAPEALTVGASTWNDHVSHFSNVGPCVDIFAPGSLVTSDWIGSSTATKIGSGTSMANPHVGKCNNVKLVCLKCLA
jgi:serine protease